MLQKTQSLKDCLDYAQISEVNSGSMSSDSIASLILSF